MTQQDPLAPLRQQVGYAAHHAKQALSIAQQAGGAVNQILAQRQAEAKQLDALQTAMNAITMSKGGTNPSIQYVENIPGRRVVFDYLVDIPITADLTSVVQQTITISQEGPFVAVARYATFNSQFQFQVIDPDSGETANFQGRSFGRYRPIHSAWDLNDGQPPSQAFQNQAFPGNAAPHMFSPSNASSFRTMQPDFRVKFENAGSSFPRSNIEVPSTFWTEQINSPFSLGALDVFERGEVLTFKVLPLHPNNPSYGNIQSFGAVNANFPFLASQYDAVEGIDDREDADAETTDPVTRLPEGVLTIGFHGYRVIQPPGISGGY